MNFQKEVLVIDGDINFGEAIKKMLALHKYHVCHASDGACCIQKAFEYNPDFKLCHVPMDPTDGCQVFSLLKDNLATSIEIQLQKFKANSSEAVHEFNTLFQLSPNGIIVFSEHAVLKANQSILTLLKIHKQKPINISIEDIFEYSSLLRIKSWIQKSIKGGNIIFNETITIKDRMDQELKMNFVISEFSKYSNVVQFIGFFTPIPKKDGFFVNDPLKSIFTKRENQVLCLSMEGLPIKMIAEKLAISSRTVEKYRTKLIEKSGANNMVEVIVFSLKNGLIKI